MFQDGQLFDHLTVARNVGYALRLRRTTAAVRERRVAELLGLVGLEGYADRMPATLSGGERQRVALARSLAAEPRLLLLDEPLSALDAGLRERLAGDLGEILRAAGTTTLLVTHDHEEAFAVADRLVVMREGRIVQQGDIEEVWARPADPETALFLGYARVLHGRRCRPRPDRRRPRPGARGRAAPLRVGGRARRAARAASSGPPAPRPSRSGWSSTSTRWGRSTPSPRRTGTPVRGCGCDWPWTPPGWPPSPGTQPG